MNEIKVTVTYDKPETSKFDALMAEYKAAKRYAEETVSHYKPLADAAEDAKFDAIVAQLETIKMYAKRISEITGKSTCIQATIPDPINYDSIEVVCGDDGVCGIFWRHTVFSKEKMHQVPHTYCEGRFNIIGNWDAWHMYEKLEQNACRQMERAIEAQKTKAQKQIDRLQNIINGGH